VEELLNGFQNRYIEQVPSDRLAPDMGLGADATGP
jgi:hypothetical protein